MKKFQEFIVESIDEKKRKEIFESLTFAINKVKIVKNLVDVLEENDARYALKSLKEALNLLKAAETQIDNIL
jgi:F0F1-type ATP synthase delta subunit